MIAVLHLTLLNAYSSALLWCWQQHVNLAGCDGVASSFACFSPGQLAMRSALQLAMQLAMHLAMQLGMHLAEKSGMQLAAQTAWKKEKVESNRTKTESPSYVGTAWGKKTYSTLCCT